MGVHAAGLQRPGSSGSGPAAHRRGGEHILSKWTQHWTHVHVFSSAHERKTGRSRQRQSDDFWWNSDEIYILRDFYKVWTMMRDERHWPAEPHFLSAKPVPVPEFQESSCFSASRGTTFGAENTKSRPEVYGFLSCFMAADKLMSRISLSKVHFLSFTL